jgi:hypothetical protein
MFIAFKTYQKTLLIMTRKFIALLCFSLLMLAPVVSNAGVPSPLRLSPGRGNWLIAAQPMLVFSPSSAFLFHGQLTYGILDNIDINGRIGAGSNGYQFLVGGDIRFAVLKSSSLRFDIYGGGHAGGLGAGFDAGAMLSSRIGIVGVMGALDVDFVVQTGNTLIPVNLDLGLDFQVVRNVFFNVTAEISLNQSVTGISGGLVFTL